MDQLQAYWPLFPEALLALGAMALLMLGAFRHEGDNTAEAIGWLAVLVLVTAGWLVIQQPAGTQRMFDGAFVVDGFARFMKLLTLVASGAALILSFDYLRQACALKFEYPVLVLLATAGMLMMISANDLIALYLGLELQSLALYVMAAIRRDDVRSSEAGLKYFVLGALSSGLLLYGASLVYGFTGSTSFQTIAAAAGQAGAGHNLGLIIGLVFLLVGLAFKISAVPFHMWTPDVYEGAPTPVTAFMSAATKVAAFAALLRILTTAFPDNSELWTIAAAVLACASLAIGNFAALAQKNVKRMLAYSSVSHAGFMLIAVAADNALGGQALLYYLIPYGATALGAFAVVAARERELQADVTLDTMAGFGWERPFYGAAMWVFMLGAAGFPLTGGFLAKLYAFSAAYEAGWWWLVVVGVVATFVSLYYYLGVVRAMYMRPSQTSTGSLRVAAVAGGSPPRDAPLAIGVAISLAVTVGSFFFVSPLIRLAREAAASLFS
jgi:NADH-quinone oxidoreductase subunit N